MSLRIKSYKGTKRGSMAMTKTDNKKSKAPTQDEIPLMGINNESRIFVVSVAVSKDVLAMILANENISMSILRVRHITESDLDTLNTKEEAKDEGFDEPRNIRDFYLARGGA